MKITFLGAGSTVFAKNTLGDVLLTDTLKDIEFALYDIDAQRAEESKTVIEAVIKFSNRKDARVSTFVGTQNLKAALKDANIVINAVQIGGYKPSTVIDFDIPKKYGLNQTIGDTLGIGGIFRALRTIPVMKTFADAIEEVCPNALFLNYTNPMAMLMGYIHKYTKIKAVGLCHSVQTCADNLFKILQMEEYVGKSKWHIAGINHQSWLLDITDLKDNDLYPEIKKRALQPEKYGVTNDLVRFDILKRFGYYNTESSEHTAEYLPYYIKNAYPELIEKYNIPLDEYPRRCIVQIENWEKQKIELTQKDKLEHKKTKEYASGIIEAFMTNKPYKIHGNVMNTNLITNLPQEACVEVPCLVDSNGINPCYVGALPEQLAALNRTNINPQIMIILAAAELKRDYIYMAAYLDPHTSAELSMDDIKNMCDDLIEAHAGFLPKYK